MQHKNKRTSSLIDEFSSKWRLHVNITNNVIIKNGVVVVMPTVGLDDILVLLVELHVVVQPASDENADQLQAVISWVNMLSTS